MGRKEGERPSQSFEQKVPARLFIYLFFFLSVQQKSIEFLMDIRALTSSKSWRY